jgi:hypothetical protein
MQPSGSELDADTAENLKIGAVEKQETQSENQAQARPASVPISMGGGGIVGSPHNSMQQGPGCCRGWGA